MIGKKILHYEILSKLGEGGMGVVYKARDTKLNREVAIKFLPRKIAASDEERQRFETEAQAAAALNHANIATIHNIEELDDESFIVMEFIDGVELKETIDRHPNGLPLEEANRYATQIAEGLAAAHKKGVVHRDIKSTNIMLTQESQIKIMDFGLAKVRGGAQVTQAGTTLGTAAYMSPEQARGEDADQRADIWSVGVVLYEMLTGHLPFSGDYDQAITYAILNEEPTPVADRRPDISSELIHVVGRSLEKEPEDRYQSIKEMLIDLRRSRRDKSRSGVAAAVVPRGGQAPAVASEATATESHLDEVGKSGTMPGAIQGDQKAESPISKRTMVTGGALVLVVLAYLLSRTLVSHDPGQSAAIQAEFAQLTAQSGQEMQPDISPDGNFIVFVKSNDIFLQRIGGGNPINLTQTEDKQEFHPAFSPDGQLIAFRANSRDSEGGIFLMGATGESVRRLTDFGFNPAWSPDGSEIVVAEKSVFANPSNRPGLGDGLWVIQVQTGDLRPISEGDAVQPSWSPNGHRIAYWAVPPNTGQRDIWTLPASGGKTVAVTDDIHLDWNPVWSADGSYLYFSSDRGGSLNIWRVPIDEQSGKALGEPEAITTPAKESFHMRLARDGSRMIYVARDRRSNLYSLPFDPVAEAVSGPAQQITQSTKWFYHPSASPDNQWIALVENRGVKDDIYLVKTDGSDTRRLTNDIHRNRTPSWSGDGQSILFYSNRGSRYDIWRIGFDGSGLEQLTQLTGPTPWRPVLFPDGKRLAYLSETATYTVDLDQPLESRQPSPVTPDTSQHFRLSSLSPDGRFMVGQLRNSDDRPRAGLAILDLASISYSLVPDRGRNATWLNDNRRILFNRDGEPIIFDRVTGESRFVKNFPDNFPFPGFGGAALTISSDNRTIYYMEDDVEADIWLATFK